METLTRLAVVLSLALVESPAGRMQLSEVPFQGRQCDGQVGRAPAPADPDRKVQLPEALAQRLTYYKADGGSGVLGPRGWNCFGLVGSSGSYLLVTPALLNTDTWESLSASIDRARTGMAIEVND